MKTAQLKKKLFQQLAITACILVLCVGGYLYIGSVESGLRAKEAATARETVTINSRTVNFQRKQQEYEEAQALWGSLSDSQKKRNGLSLGLAQQLLENLRTQYGLGSFKVEISKPEALKDSYQTETTMVMSTTVNITFDALTDESVFAFIAALNRSLPGYVKIDSLLLTREGEINNVMVKNLQDGKYQSVVRGQMTFLWRDLKDVTPEPAPASAPAPTPPPTPTPGVQP